MKANEERQREWAAESKARRWAIFVGVVLMLVLVSGDLAWNQYVYGDWRCAWAQCRKVEVVK